MAITTHQADVEPDHWDAAGPAERTSVQLSRDMTVNYPDGTSDTLTAGVSALGGTELVANTNQGSGDIEVGADTTETIITGLDITLTGSTGSITVSWDIWFSMNNPFVAKQGTVRIRRTNTSGTVLASHIIPDTGDSTAGHVNHWTGTYVDTAPTDGHYVMTIQNTAIGTGVHFWTNAHVFEASGATSTATAFNRSKDVYVIFTVKGSGTLRVMKESEFIATFGG